MQELDLYLPYAFALIIASPIIFLVKKGVSAYITLKERELKLLSQKGEGAYRVQAFERLTLYLERIKPSHLVNNFDTNLQPHEFVFLTEKSIKEELDYNASMQLYIGKVNWQNIIQCQDRMIRLLQTTYQQLLPNAVLSDFKTLFLMNFILMKGILLGKQWTNSKKNFCF